MELHPHIQDIITVIDKHDKRLANYHDDVSASQSDITQGVQHLQYSISDLRELVAELNLEQTYHQLQTLEQQQRQHTLLLQSLGEEYLQQMKQSLADMNDTLNDSSERWNRAGAYLLRSASEITASFNPNEFRDITQNSCLMVENATNSALHKIKSLVRWFHWKNLITVMATAIFASVVTSMYLADEYPWEVHKTVARERLYGKAVISSWSDLSKAERQRIYQHLRHELV